MKIVVGLGNPGKKYERTRHNVGFILLDNFSQDRDLTWRYDKRSQAEVSSFGDILLVKPQTFMNRSGISVSYLVNYYKLSLEDLIVIHDELDLPFGEIKLQKNVGSAGHLGVEDVIVSLKSKDFWRYRVGIGRPKNIRIDMGDWVLTEFTSQELEELQNVPLPISGY